MSICSVRSSASRGKSAPTTPGMRSNRYSLPHGKTCANPTRRRGTSWPRKSSAPATARDCSTNLDGVLQATDPELARLDLALLQLRQRLRNVRGLDGHVTARGEHIDLANRFVLDSRIAGQRADDVARAKLVG